MEQRCDERGLLMLPHVDAHTDVHTQAEQKSQPSPPDWDAQLNQSRTKETDSGTGGKHSTIFNQ